MDIDRRIEMRMRRPMPHRRYREYARPFQVLLAVADLATWLYFFGIPFFPHLLPHLSDFSLVVNFLVEGFKKGMH